MWWGHANADVFALKAAHVHRFECSTWPLARFPPGHCEHSDKLAQSHCLVLSIVPSWNWSSLSLHPGNTAFILQLLSLPSRSEVGEKSVAFVCSPLLQAAVVCRQRWKDLLHPRGGARDLIESKPLSVSLQSLKWLFARHVYPFALINSYGAKRNVLPCLSCHIRAPNVFPRS